MNSREIEAVKGELEQLATGDAAIPERSRRMRNITRETGQFLSVLIRATAARRILEIGTSNGYSTLWLAEAAVAAEGSVTTVESLPYKVELASANFARAGLAGRIELIHDDAARVLERAATSGFDFVFLDSARTEYPPWWPHVRRVLRPGGLLVADNATSHAEELAPFIELVRADSAFTSCLVPVGKGEFLAVKMSGRALFGGDVDASGVDDARAEQHP